MPIRNPGKNNIKGRDRDSESALVDSSLWTQSSLISPPSGVSKTIRDFDERLTHKMFGYTSNDAYYKAAILRDRLHQIKGCPMVCLNALDDPFCPETSVPVDGAAKCDNVALVLTDFGGHIGFIEGVSPYGPNFSDRLFRQLAQNVFAC